MEIFKGTPAPWSFKEFNNYKIRYRFFITSHNGKNVCKIVRDDNDNNEEELANAKLLCAAPDLLQAAMDFVNKVESGKAKSTDSYNKFKAAINKALGE